jgi:hypothetical protein
VFAPTLLLVPTLGPLESVQEYEKIARIMAFIFANHVEFMLTGANMKPFACLDDEDWKVDVGAVKGSSCAIQETAVQSSSMQESPLRKDINSVSLQFLVPTRTLSRKKHQEFDTSSSDCLEGRIVDLGLRSRSSSKSMIQRSDSLKKDGKAERKSSLKNRNLDT